jgi:lipid A 3-O-deacylase
MALCSLIRKTLACLLVIAALRGGPCFAAAAEVLPVSSLSVLRYEWDVSSGVFWRVSGSGSQLPYVLTPLIISVKIPPVNEHQLWGGVLVMRSRFSLLLEPIVRGPEHYYVGVAAAGDLEWRDPSGHFAAFFASGGGFGLMDSKGYQVVGGQGQDFNFNWLVHSGVRYRTSAGWQISLGAYFQHISNRGLNKINPGINALGPMLGISRRF